MNRSLFIFLCLGWLMVLGAMMVLGHLGRHLIPFSILYVLAFVLLFFLVITFPENLEPPRAFLLIVILGFTGRAIFLYYPVGNDVYRYVWEGYIQNQGFNPFIYAPDDPALSSMVYGKLYPIWQSINHKEFSAAYPPLTLLIFRALAGLDPDPFFFKFAMVLFDLGTMIILARIIILRRLPMKQLLLYACNPLVIVFIAGEGHLDVVQVFFIFLGVLFIFSRKEITGFLSLGLAVVSKYFALLAVPFLITYQSRKKWIAVLLPLLLYMPYLDAGGDMFRSLIAFGARMHYNDSLFALIRFLFPDSAYQAGIIFLLFCLIWIFLFVHDRLRSAYSALGCLLVFLPSVHPWYVVLLAPFMVFFPSKAWLYLQASVVFTFPVMAIDYQTGVFHEIYWLKLLEYGPFYALLAWGIFRDGYLFRIKSYPPPQDISVIIPTLNESEYLGPCLTALKDRAAVKEIIVADGGSTDDTRQIAIEYGAKVVQSQKGRGIQIKGGLQAASGDVFIILHADCIPKKGLFSNVIRVLAANPHAAGGACGMEFEKKQAKTRIVAFLNNARSFLTGISFGDQAQFFRANALEQMGGFPAVTLMEDVELSLRLRQTGKLLYLREGVLASGRRWGGRKFLKNFITVLWLFTRYLVERRIGRGAAGNQQYYIAYYGQSR